MILIRKSKYIRCLVCSLCVEKTLYPLKTMFSFDSSPQYTHWVSVPQAVVTDTWHFKTVRRGKCNLGGKNLHVPFTHFPSGVENNRAETVRS